MSSVPIGKWIEITGLYQIVEDNFRDFTSGDLSPVTSYNKEPTWHRNLRNALQSRKKRGEILWDGKARYKIERPSVRRMIQEAVNSISSNSSKVSHSEINDYILNHWDNVEPETVNAQIAALTVNDDSRVHYPENQKSRRIGLVSPYDLFYKTERDKIEKYQPDKHGIWEITQIDSKLSIRQIEEGSETKIFTPSDIIWFKNVTNSDLGSAYLNLTSDEFVLHFPNKHKTNALSPRVNEIILLYQKVDEIAVFTHLVTPIDNELHNDISRAEYKYGRKVKVIAIVSEEKSIPVFSTAWNQISLSGIAQGNVCEIKNVSSVNNIEELQFNTWQCFQGFFNTNGQSSEAITSSIITELRETNLELSILEGKAKLVSHLVRERSRRIVYEKKQMAIYNNQLNCEVCSFSFKKEFDKNYIECHHIVPIGYTGEVKTTLDDLALVCANCHRMLHTKFEGKYLTVKELRDIRGISQ